MTAGSKWTEDERVVHARAWRAAEAAMQAHASQRRDELTTCLMWLGLECPDARVIVEVGCDAGGTLAGWQLMFPDAAVYGVTLPVNRVEDGGQGYQLDAHGAGVLFGDSHDRVTVQRLKDQLGGRAVDILFIDGDHSYDGARSDWTLYAPLVRAGGFVVFHDVMNESTPQVVQFWRDLRAEAQACGEQASVSEIVSTTHIPVGFGIVRMAGEQ